MVDVVDAERPVGINVLDQDHPQTIASNMQSLFDAIYGSSGVVVPEALYHGVMLLLGSNTRASKLTFTDLAWIFAPKSEEQFMHIQRLAGGLQDEEIGDWWEDMFLRYRTYDKFAANFAPIRRRIWQIAGRPELHNIFGQSNSSFDMFTAIQQRKIILVNISGLGDAVKNLVGAICVDMLWAAIKRGAASPPRPFHLFLDEFQNYPNLARDADTMMSEGRAFGLSMWLANQGLNQLSPGLQRAISVNTRNKVVMQTDSGNARAFVSDFGRGVTEEQIVSLGNHEAVCRLVGLNGVTPPFSVKLSPPLPPVDLSAEVLAHSRQTYGRPVAEVEAEIRSRRRLSAKDRKERPPLGKLGEQS